MVNETKLKKMMLQKALFEALHGKTQDKPLYLATFIYTYSSKVGADTGFLLEDAEECVEVLRDQGHLIVNDWHGYWIATTYEEWQAWLEKYLTPRISRLLGRLQSMSERAKTLRSPS